MRFIGLVLLLIGLSMAAGLIIGGVDCSQTYAREYQSYWDLAERASTITAKCDYIDSFATRLGNSGLAGTYDARVYKNRGNAFDDNYAALKTLQSRLHEIKKMDVASTQYQFAIQQITAQEQGEAASMMKILYGCYVNTKYPRLWEWEVLIWGFIAVVFVVFGIAGIMD
jgi:hypothetical protein